ncbi:MAG: F0F1 ATP synthase subunit epsilon [Planctomycetes bacterium]|nr:F0F1 ATP synthase subunit epsilon [Planctomycetota bacterium]
MVKELTLRIITPERVVLDTTAESVRVPATDGSMGIFPRHAGMVAALDAGELIYQEGGRERRLFVAGGFAEVRHDTIRVLTSAGEKPGEIDVERARAAEERARERLKPHRTGLTAEEATIDIARANAALRRAILRLKVHGYAN